MQKQLVKVGTLVMWNVKSSKSYGDVGIVTWVGGDKENFFVMWSSDSEVCNYDNSHFEEKNLKVVNF